MTGPAEHYAAQRARVTELVRGLTTEQLETRTLGCPDWTVREVLSHLTGLSVDVNAGRLEGAGSPAWSSAQVAARQGKTVEELVTEWEAEAATMEKGIDLLDAWVFVWDITMHQDDMLEALGRPLAVGDTQSNVVNGLVRRAGKNIGEAGLPALRIRAGDQEWTAGEGEPGASFAVSDERELARVLGGRRSHDRMRALAWTGDPEPYLPHLTLFPPGG